MSTFFFSVAEAADYLGVAQSTVRSAIRRGAIPAYRLPGSSTVRIDRLELQASLESVPVEVPAC